jgi:hypothetical protein
MRPRIALIAASLVLLAAFPEGASWGRTAGSRASLAYNANAEQVVRGVVEAIGGPRNSHLLAGAHLTLLTSGVRLDVHLGPVESRRGMGNYDLHVGDQVEVTGYLIHFNGVPVLLARTVKCGDQILTFRNKLGIPVAPAGPRVRAGTFRSQ